MGVVQFYFILKQFILVIIMSGTKSPESVKLGAAIRDRRRRLKLTQYLLSIKADINRSHLSLIESGEHHPTVRTINAIAEALNTTPEGLEWTGDYLATIDDVPRQKMYPGLRELFEDEKTMTLYKISPEEKRVLQSIRLQWKNPSKQFFEDALLDYRLSNKKESE